MNKLITVILLFISGIAVSNQYEELVYQDNSDLVAALKFAGSPVEQVDKLMPMVRGELANDSLLSFSNKIIESRESKSESLLMKLMHQENLMNPGKELQKLQVKIKDGSIIYGNKGYKYFVTNAPIETMIIERYFKKNITKPSLVLYFYHFHPSNSMLIGSPFYLSETENGYKIILPKR